MLVQDGGIVNEGTVKVVPLGHLFLRRIVNGAFLPDGEGVISHHRGRLAVYEALQGVCLGANGRERRVLCPVERPYQDVAAGKVVDVVLGAGATHGVRVTYSY